MAVCQNLVPLVNIKIAGKWMFIPLKMVSIGIDPYPYSDKSLFYLFQGLPQQFTPTKYEQIARFSVNLTFDQFW